LICRSALRKYSGQTAQQYRAGRPPSSGSIHGKISFDYERFDWLPGNDA
jgi:hypothetical protein